MGLIVFYVIRIRGNKVGESYRGYRRYRVPRSTRTVYIFPHQRSSSFKFKFKFKHRLSEGYVT